MPAPEPPAGPLARLLRSGGLRRLGKACVVFFLSLAVGRACEIALSAQTLSAALSAQSRGIATVRRLTPLSLTTGYLSDLRPASRGDVIYRAPPSVVNAAITRLNRDDAERRTACRLALGFASPGSIPPACAALGVTDPAQFILQERQSRRPVDFKATVAAATRTADTRVTVPVYLVPMAAIVRTATRVTSEGVFPSVIALLQLTAGMLFVLVVTQSMSSTHTAGFKSAIGNVVFLPIASVAAGSVLAWVLQALMLGALQGFQWLTGLAAAAAGASGMAGFCWYCVTKLGEQSVEGVMTRKT